MENNVKLKLLINYYFVSAGRYYYKSVAPRELPDNITTALPTMPEVAFFFGSSTNVQRCDRQMMATYLVKYNTGIFCILIQHINGAEM